jgi:hypothetical protein
MADRAQKAAHFDSGADARKGEHGEHTHAKSWLKRVFSRKK